MIGLVLPSPLFNSSVKLPAAPAASHVRGNAPRASMACKFNASFQECALGWMPSEMIGGTPL